MHYITLDNCLEAGYRHRSKGFASDVAYDARVAYRIFPKWWLQVRSIGRQSLYDTEYYQPDGSLIGGKLGLYASSEIYYTIEPAVQCNFTRQLGFSTGLSRIIVGDNVPKATTFFLTLHFQNLR